MLLKQRIREQGEIIGGGHLRRVRQARGVLESGIVEAQIAGLVSHHDREFLLGAAKVLGDDDGHVIGGLRDQREDGVLNLDLGSGLQFEVRGRLGGGVTGHRHLVGQADFAGIDRIKQKVKRHHLRERSRITGIIGVAGVQDFVGLGVHDQRGVLFSRGSLGNQQGG